MEKYRLGDRRDLYGPRRRRTRQWEGRRRLGVLRRSITDLSHGPFEVPENLKPPELGLTELDITAKAGLNPLPNASLEAKAILGPKRKP